MNELDNPYGFCAPGPYHITHYIPEYITSRSLQLVRHLLFPPGPTIPNVEGGGGHDTHL